MSTYYPLLLNIEGRTCVVIGGGVVAERKVRSLVERGATVTVVSTTISAGLNQMVQQGLIQLLQRNYQPGDLANALLVISATDDPELNKKVATEARRLKALVNVVDDPENSDFIVPSVLSRGDICVAVSTSGKSPALARKIRSELEQYFSEEYSSLATLVAEVRQELKSNKVRIAEQKWQDVLELHQLLQMIRERKYEHAKERLLSNILNNEQQGHAGA